MGRFIAAALITFSALALAHAQSLTGMKPPQPVSAEVKATLESWAPSMESANYPVAVMKFTNTSKKACVVKRYQLHWSEGTFEGKPDLKIDPGKTVEHRAKLLGYPTPTDKVGVVQVWETDCGS
jgi:hypothetical protein